MSTSHRRTWDREEYARRAAERRAREHQEWLERRGLGTGTSAAHAEDTDADAELLIRQERINLAENVNKIQLLPAGAPTGRSRRGKGAGYYCSDCNETYKDSLAWLDHLNSPVHLRRSGQPLNVKRATLEDVRRRLAYLRDRLKGATAAEAVDERSDDNEDKVKNDNEKIVIVKSDKEQSNGDEATDDNEESAMMNALGISSFGTTKK